MTNAVVERVQDQAPLAPTAGTALAVTPMDMLASALERGVPPETLDKFMGLAERWEKSQNRKAFDKAIAAAKAEIPVIGKTATGHNEKKYADLASIARVVDPIISRHGLSYRFRTMQTEKLISVTCVLSHDAGHFEETTLAGPADQTGSKNAIQAIGSTLTYLQRYSLVQALGLAASDDDDGRSAGDGGAISQEQIERIQSLIVETAANIARFCTYMKVKRIEDIPAARFAEAVKALEAKRSKAS